MEAILVQMEKHSYVGTNCSSLEETKDNKGSKEANNTGKLQGPLSTDRLRNQETGGKLLLPTPQEWEKA